MKEFKIHSKGENWIHFRSDMESACEAFTVIHSPDGTVCMTGDYGTLSWRRHWPMTSSDKNLDYGFPGQDTSISYFEEKVCQFGIKQEIREWNKQKAIEMFKERYKEHLEENAYEEALQEFEWLEEYDETKFYETLRTLDCDCFEYEWRVYTSQFLWMFECLKSVSDTIWKELRKPVEQKAKA
jgi:hypothetical protein